MTNFAKFGSNEPLEGGSTAIFACNHAKPLSSMFFYQMPTFLTPGKVIGNKKVFSLHPTAYILQISKSFCLYRVGQKGRTFLKSSQNNKL